MESIANRLARLEARTPPPARARPGRVTLAEIRALEAKIRLLEAGADEVGPAPEADVVESVAPGEEIAAIVRKLERLERLDQADGKDRNE
jgi:hypothetical protein